MTFRRQLLLQLLCLFVTATVLFPILYIVGLAVDPRNLSRPDGLFPPGASLDAFARVIEHPTQLDPVSFLDLAINSFKLAAMTAIVTVLIGVTAAYAFSRLKFRGREFLMIAILGVLMLPAVATIAPLFIFLNGIKVDLPILGSFNLRQSLLGVALAVISGALPFAIWNLKGYLDTIPKDLEEAAAVDGATQNQTFLRVVLPLAMPAIAVTAFLGFLSGWTEFYFVSTFLRDPKDYTLAYELNKMVGAVRPDAVVRFRGVRDPVLAARVGGVLLLPALHRRRPGHRRRQGLTVRRRSPGVVGRRHAGSIVRRRDH